jgi:hypothetical protein
MSYEGRRRPIFERLPIEADLDAIRQEVKLWRAVLDMALYDAFMDCDTLEEEKDKNDARNFWDGETEDLRTVCDLAAIDYDFARKVYSRFRARFG